MFNEIENEEGDVIYSDEDDATSWRPGLEDLE